MDLIYLIIGLLCLLFLYYLRNGAIFVPLNPRILAVVVELVAPDSSLRVADLGSGDGRIVAAFARKQARCVGFENNLLLYWWSVWQLRRQSLREYGQIRWANFWRQDLSEFDVVVVFGMTHIMDRLARKLRAELKPGSRVVSCLFQFKNLDLIAAKDGVWVYRI
jgi:protein-L-isoaspartate O-methyltransferase